MNPDCLLIADDLTGACDAAVQFVSRGHRVRVSLHSGDGAGQADVLAVSTESRDSGVAVFRHALDRLRSLRPRILFKKIDSTLRGNVGQEVASTLAAFHCDVAVVTPAFPAMGRLVEGGYLRIAGEIGFVPVELTACFRHLPASSDTRFVLLDANCDADLDAIVSNVLGWRERILWAGSAGLAAALARSTPAGKPDRLAFSPAPAIFCLGSSHPVTMEQQQRLIHHRAATLFTDDAATPEGIRGALQRGPVVLRIRRGCTGTTRLRELLENAPSPLVLSGGDTASVACRALDVRAIELRQEVAPGIPCGLLQGGPFDQLPVVTKSGGFGGPDALMQVADFFTCPQP